MTGIKFYRGGPQSVNINPRFDLASWEWEFNIVLELQLVSNFTRNISTHLILINSILF